MLHRKRAREPGSSGSFIGKKALSKPFRIRQRDEMAASFPLDAHVRYRGAQWGAGETHQAGEWLGEL